jgi:hypothetical protein
VLRAITFVLCWAATGVLAQEIDRSPRPPANPLSAGVEAGAPASAVLAAPASSVTTEDPTQPVAGGITAAGADTPRPKPRPQTLAVAAKAAEPVTVAAADDPATGAADPETGPGSVLTSSLRPEPRPRALAERIAALKASAAAPGIDLSSNPGAAEEDLAAVEPPTAKERRKKKREAASMKGSVCGVAAIKGEEIKRISSKVKGCGVEDPVAVTSVSGVRLSQAATVDCSIARSLNSWVDEVAQPAFDGKLVELQVAAHYICRSRNNKKGAKISEHGKGRAVDISAFILSNGKVLTVAGNYNKLLRRIYKAACPYFRTTLGPGSDGYHEDHFHFDTSARSGGAYCR